MQLRDINVVKDELRKMYQEYMDKRNLRDALLIQEVFNHFVRLETENAKLQEDIARERYARLPY